MNEFYPNNFYFRKFLENGQNHSACPQKENNVCIWPLRDDDLWLYENGITVVVVAISRSQPPHGTNKSMLTIEEQSDHYFINATQIGIINLLLLYKLVARQLLGWNCTLKGDTFPIEKWSALPYIPDDTCSPQHVC